VVDEPPRPPAEQPVHKAPLQQQLLEVLAVVAARLDLTPELDDLQQHDQVQDADQPQEHARHAGTDDAADLLEVGDV
jgi:hypothetical protein